MWTGCYGATLCWRGGIEPYLISNGRSYKGDIEIAPFEPDDEDTLVEAGLLTAATEKGKAWFCSTTFGWNHFIIKVFNVSPSLLQTLLELPMLSSVTLYCQVFLRNVFNFTTMPSAFNSICEIRLFVDIDPDFSRLPRVRILGEDFPSDLTAAAWSHPERYLAVIVLKFVAADPPPPPPPPAAPPPPPAAPPPPPCSTQ